MDFCRVEAALEIIGLRDQYIGGFREKCLEDDNIDFEDPYILSTLKSVMPNAGHRVAFMNAFKAPPDATLDSQDAQPPPHHEKYVNIKALDIKGDSKIPDIDNKLLLHFGNVRKIDVSMGESSGHSSNKRKMEVENVEFQIQDPIPWFTGREEVLEDLHKKIQDGKVKGEHMTILSQTIVISGMGGVGKTQMLRKYILKFKHQYDHVIWINAENEAAMSTSLFKLADNELGISCVNDEGQRDSDEVIRENVYDNLCEKRCLIVFDNAASYDQEGGIQKFLPSTIKRTWQAPIIIVTSRIRDWEPYVLKERVIQLGGLTEGFY